MQGAGLLTLGAVAAAACSKGSDTLTTLDTTIGLDGEDLVHGPGEPYAIRTELAESRAGRERRRRSLAVFHHFSDFRIVDEESPLRSEWVDDCANPLSTEAFRPQETLSLQAAAAIVAAANRIDRSLVTGRSVDFAIHTGNAADNAQFNELRAFLDLMDGREVHPDTGGPGYEGIQSESPAGAYPDVLEQAQLSFTPSALRYPWYAVAGNRDTLAQGNFPPNDSANSIATGSTKLISLGDARREELCSDPSDMLAPGSSTEILSDPETLVLRVTPDAARRLLSRKGWVEEHFRTETAPGPVGHGLTEENRSQGSAYYTFERGPVLFIVLDTVNPGGFAAGSIDSAQFAWLEQQLIAHSSSYFDTAGRRVETQSQDRIIVIASHHPAGALNNPFPDPDVNENRFRGPQFEDLLHRFPNVILHVAGHLGGHRITAKPGVQGGLSGYWEITTASPLDYPMQARLVEIVSNGDGTISIFSLVYDSAAPIKPGDAGDPTPGDGINELLLASVARQVGTRDPQLDQKAAGLAASDRNAELLIAAPFDPAEASPASPSRAGPAGGVPVDRREFLRSFLPRS